MSNWKNLRNCTQIKKVDDIYDMTWYENETTDMICVLEISLDSEGNNCLHVFENGLIQLYFERFMIVPMKDLDRRNKTPCW